MGGVSSAGLITKPALLFMNEKKPSSVSGRWVSFSAFSEAARVRSEGVSECGAFVKVCDELRGVPEVEVLKAVSLAYAF